VSAKGFDDGKKPSEARRERERQSVFQILRILGAGEGGVVT
jgi:hypothetical protein